MEENSQKTPIIISLGGSLIIPEEIDVDFLKSFKTLIEEKIKAGDRFVLICGGGKLCRKYQEVAGSLNTLSQDDLDWLGIASTKLNAELVKHVFAPLTEESVVSDPFAETNFTKPILIASGWKPGWSTDYDAICLAEKFGAKKVINLSNIDFVYDKDPRTNPDAQKIEKISWADFREIIPKEWGAGLSSPFDPVASKKAEELGIEVSILNGKKTEELRKCIEGGEFEGTKIS